MSKFLKTIRGTRDVMGRDLELQKDVISKAKKCARSYCYQEISTPIFEDSSVFHRTLGDTSDMVSKETYTFLDREKTSITLRPEFTAAIVRAFISNGLTQALPSKMFSYGPLFRHERPQHCRYRQFNQVSFEYFGSFSYLADVEIILMAHDLIKALGLSDIIQIEINTLGSANDRASYKEALVEYFSKYKDELSDQSLVRLEKNPLRILDSKDKGDREIVTGCPLISDYLSSDSKSRYEKIREFLSSAGINYKINDKLVRGMDYYTHTVFEFTTEELGAQGTVLAGGRYDGLVEIMGGASTSAIGFAAGVERLAELYGKYKNPSKKDAIFHIIPIGDDAEKYSVNLAQKLRSEGIVIHLEYGISLKKRMQKANKGEALGVIVIGDDELKSNKCNFKNMKSGKEEEVDLDSLANYLLTSAE